MPLVISDDENLEASDAESVHVALVGLEQAELGNWLNYVSALQKFGSSVVNVGVESTKETGLHFAAAQGKQEYCGLLLHRGAEPNVRTAVGRWTPLHHCADPDGDPELFAARSEVARMLLAYGADVNARDDEGETPLFHAARYGDSRLVNVLINHGALVNIEGDTPHVPFQICKYTPLVEAIFGGSVEIVRTLIENGADAERQENQERLEELATQYTRDDVLAYLRELREA